MRFRERYVPLLKKRFQIVFGALLGKKAHNIQYRFIRQ